MAKATPAGLDKLSKADLLNLLTTALSQAPAETTPEPETLTSKQQADVLIEESPFTHTTGRVYISGAMIEASARVLNTGAPEIVKTPVTGKRTAAVAIWRQDEHSVAVQNLRAI